MSDAFSAIMITGELVLPETIVGMTEASTMLNAPTPVHSQLFVDDSHAVTPHLAGSNRVEDRGGDVPSAADQFIIALKFLARKHLLRPELRDGARLHETAGMADGFCSKDAIFAGREVVGLDLGSCGRIRPGNVDRPPALRSQVAGPIQGDPLG